MRNIADSGHTRLIYNDGIGTNFIVSQPINDEPATVANGSTVAFSCNSPEQVKHFHDTAVANGGTSIEAPPGPLETASMGTIELAYFREPDGDKLVGFTFQSANGGLMSAQNAARLWHERGGRYFYKESATWYRPERLYVGPLKVYQ